MHDEELRRLLADANPWWRAAVTGADPLAWISSHRLLRERGRYDLGYRPTVLQDIATRPISDLLVVLAGPRRVGKSVTLIDTVAALCARADVDTRQIIHVPCDGMRERDLRRVLTLGRELTRSVDLQPEVRRVWLLDEISTIPGWTAVLKAAVAAGREEVRFDIDAYDLAWQDCLICGGLPRAVAEYSRLGGVSEVYLHDLLAWLRRDVDLDAPPESVPLLLQEPAQRATSPLNVTRTAHSATPPGRRSIGA